MKGVILAGGTGSRLCPCTNVINKHLLPVGQKPMIFHVIDKLTTSGITEIMIVTGVDHMGMMVQSLGSGKDFNCHFTYRVQDEAGGIAQALKLCKGFCQNDRLCAILGDNIFQDKLLPYIERYLAQPKGAMVLLKDVPDPQRFGVAEVDPNTQKILEIEEKPRHPKSKWAVTGIYFYDCRVFDIIDTLKMSARGELEITDVNNEYIKRGELSYDILKGWWTDLGTFESLARGNALVFGV